MKNSLFAWFNFFQGAPKASEMSQMRLRYAEVIEPIHGGSLNQKGRIQFDGTSYYAVSARDLPIARGTLVVLLSRSGNTWSVVPAPVASAIDPSDSLLTSFEETATVYQQQYQTSSYPLPKFWLDVLLTSIVIVQALGGTVLNKFDPTLHDNPPIHNNWN